ncbi:MAG TPA: tetrahydromethanopterin S-methyltransferase subunit F [Methanocorpusculum sp.]|nr:tetrahydromethanopterin S-methyltransferase subunit F [Methanocorpusculum sp.]
MAGSSIRMAAINKIVDNVKYKGQLLARTYKVESAFNGCGVVGVAVGAAISLVLILVPVIIFGGVF